MALICLYLMIKEVEHLLPYFLLFRYSIFMYLLKTFSYFGIPAFSLLICKSSLYVLGSPFVNLYIYKYHCLSCSFSSASRDVFGYSEDLNFNGVLLTHFVFYGQQFFVCLLKVCLHQGYKEVLVCFL